MEVHQAKASGLLGIDDLLATSEDMISENGRDTDEPYSAADTDDEMVLESAVNAPLVGDTPVKRKKKSKGQRGIGKPNGFEEYYVDAPITPAEYAQEQNIYDPNAYNFATRVMTAIHRYETKRRLDPERRDYFYKYLVFGGIEVGPNMFQGSSVRDREELDKEQITESLAQTSITSDKEDIGTDRSKYAVDFEGCIKGFLSRRVPYLYSLDTQESVSKVTGTLKNFLNYLLYHDVCPEYTQDIHAARIICDRATTELWLCREAERWLPGDFNVACSTLFGGEYGKNYVGETTDWDDKNDAKPAFLGMTKQVASQVVRFGLAGAGTEEQFETWLQLAEGFGLCVDWEEDEIGLEVLSAVRPDDGVKSFYRENCRNFRALGRLRCRRWRNPAERVWDLTKEEMEKERKKRQSGEIRGEEVVELYVEDQVLQHCLVGMRFEADLKHVNCGIWFLDRIYRVYCSFDTYMVNERMLEWKEPRAMPPKGADGEVDGELVGNGGANGGTQEGMDRDRDSDKVNVPALEADHHDSGW